MILITEFMDAAAVAKLQSAFPTSYRPELADHQDDIPPLLPGVSALIVRNRTQVTAKLLESADQLRLIGRLGVGLDNIDLTACDQKRIEVIPATGANTLSVAEYVVTNALVLLRNAYCSRSKMIAGDWPRTECAGREAATRQLGLVGFGAIARETARLARALGMRVAGCDPHLKNSDPIWQQTRSMSFENLLASSDVISLHVPLNDSTRHLIDQQALARMRRGSVLINAARGGVVSESALVAAMRSGHIAGAALDVFENEPLDAKTALIFEGIDNLILTPHIAGVTQDSNTRVSAMIADCILQGLNRIQNQ